MIERILSIEEMEEKKIKTHSTPRKNLFDPHNMAANIKKETIALSYFKKASIKSLFTKPLHYYIFLNKIYSNAHPTQSFSISIFG